MSYSTTKEEGTMESAYQTFLEAVYQDTTHKIPYTTEELSHFAVNHICHTYGEIYYPSLICLLEALAPTPQDVFLDLGSGLGKCALTVFLRTDMKRVIGIEASKPLHEQAMRVIRGLLDTFPNFLGNRFFDLQRGNFLDFDFNQATILYTCSTCFSQALLWKIGEKINEADRVKQVVSLNPIPSLERLPLKQVVPIECSWDSALAYHYVQ